MPSYAHVAVDLRCPGCDRSIASLLRFTWGYCPGYNVRDHLVYRVGDAIRWRACRSGAIPPWTFFGPAECNAGDPAYRDLVLRDDSLTGETHECLARLGGAAIEVRGGLITRTFIFLPGELEDDDASIYLIGDHGELNSMWDWESHPMSRLNAKDCGELRFATVHDNRTAPNTP